MALLALLLGACGTNKRDGTPATALTTYGIASEPSQPPPPEPKADRDGDTDGSIDERHDRDDSDVLRYGHAAGPADARAIGALVSHYYSIAVAENGAKACSMMYSTLEEAVPEDFGTSPPAPSYSAGKTCPEVLTKVFRHAHALLASGLARLRVSSVRVKGRHGLALLSLGDQPEREFQVGREGHTWRIETLMGDTLP